MSESERIIAEFPKDQEEKVRLGLRAYKGKVYFDLRVWFTDKQTQAIVPSKRGICLNVDFLPQIREFLDALETAKASLPADFAAQGSSPKSFTRDF